MAMYRPLVVLSYALTYALAGYSPWPYLLFNMLVHALVAILVTLLVADRTGQVVLGWWTGALFAVHPINAQVVNYISSRSESLAIMGGLNFAYFLVQLEVCDTACAHITTHKPNTTPDGLHP